MAASQRILSLNIGSQTLSVAEFHAAANGGLVLNAFAMRELLAEAGDAERNAAIATVLREMLTELKIKNGAVNYAVPGQSVFARFVKLPTLDQEKIEQIVTFEAQQNVPFPIEEVVWDYQLVGAGADEKVEVVLVAIKADLLEGINAAVEGAGVRTQLVDVATMALYNAFRYNYSELTGCSLLVDIGARTTNLIFVEPGRVFSRSIPIGGSTISASIAKELGEPAAAAEFRKKRDGFVSLGGAYAEPSDPDVARVSKIVRNTMTRLHAELTRSISFYRAQQQGSQPERVFLCGGSSSMPYMREFFFEKLHLPIEFFNPMRNVTAANAQVAAAVSHSAHLLGELVGLALRSTTTCPMELNLRPASVVRAQELVRRRPFLITAAACLVLAIAGWGFYYARAAQVERDAIAKVQPKIDAMRGIESRMAEVRRQTTALDAVATPILAAVNDRDFWLQVLEDLNARLPKENIWITELVPTSGGKPLAIDTATGRAAATPPPAATPQSTPTPRRGATPAPTGPMMDGLLLRGLYLSNPRQQEVVVDYFRALLDSPFFAIDPKNQAKVLKPTTPNATDWAFPYELHLDFKTPRPLP